MTDSGRSKRLGDAGEELAAGEYAKRGYELLERQYSIRGVGEVDLILRGEDGLVMSEVKTRSGHGYGTPEEAVTALKRQRLRRVAQHYMREHPGCYNVRFDVVSVTIDKQNITVDIIEEAFQ